MSRTALGIAFALTLGLLTPATAAGRPDLVESALSKPPATRARGARFSVTDTVKNAGSATAGASVTRYYLSVDRKKGKDVLLGARSVAKLRPKRTSRTTKTVTIPTSTRARSYYLLVCADAKNAVRESREGNNCRASSTTIRVTVPDTTPPAVPQITGSNPASPANDATPYIRGTAESGSTVRLFATDDCSDAPVASGTAVAFAGPGLDVTLAEGSTTTFTATATDASGNRSTCSAAFTYRDIHEVEPNNDHESATLMTSPTISGSIAQAGDEDYFRVTVPPGGGSIVAETFDGSGTTCGPETDTALSLYDRDGMTRLVERDGGGEGGCAAIDGRWSGGRDPAARALDPGVYFLVVREADDNDVIPAYNLAVRVAPLTPPPAVTGTSPSAPGPLGTDDNQPEVRGSAVDGSTVYIWTVSNCQGTPVASGTAARFNGAGITVDVADNATTTFYAAALYGEADLSQCSATSVSYVEETPGVETELNDTRALANPVAGPSMRGAIQPPTDLDYYSVTIEENEGIVAETTGSGGAACGAFDTVVRLYSSAGIQLVSDDNDGDGDCSKIDGSGSAPVDAEAANLAAGTYYLSVEEAGNDGMIDEYRLRVAIVDPAPIEEEEEAGLNDSITQASLLEGQSLSENGSFSGSISRLDGTPGDTDYFEIVVPQASTVRFESFVPNPGGCDGTTTTIRLYNPTGTVLYADQMNGINDCSAIVAHLEAGRYYLQILETNNDQSIEEYRLEVRFMVDRGAETEVNDTTTGADNLPGKNAVIWGEHSPYDPDFFKITIPPGGRSLRAEIIEGGVERCFLADFQSLLVLHDSTGRQLAFNDLDGRGFCSLIDGTGSAPKDPKAHALAAGTYYLEVRHSNLASDDNAQTFDYRLAITIR